MKIFVGRVIGTKMAKTAVVSVERVVVHPLYQKRFRRDRKYQVQDEFGVKLNDVVRFAASRPYSKTKKWKILEVVGGKKSETLTNVEVPKAKEIRAVKVAKPARKARKGATK